MKADKEQLRLIVEAIGIISIVLSLLFVSLQLLQDRRVAIGEQYAARAETALSQIRTQLESDAYLETFSKRWENGTRPGWWSEENVFFQGKVTPRDVVVISMLYRYTLIGFDNLYFQYRQGLLDEEEWTLRRNTLRDLLSRDKMRRAYYTDSRSNTYTVLSILQEMANEIDNGAAET
jgi:hypothetical protein